MGTSRSLGAPAGGKWTDLKRGITGYLGGNVAVTPARILGSTVVAAGGLAVPLASSGSADPKGGGGGRGGGGAATTATARRAISGAAAALGGFGASVREGGLGEALDRLGLGELRGRPAAEVIARIAEHLARETDGLANDVLSTALSEALLEAARLEGDTSYEALETSLDAFIARNGIEGLMALFLTRYVFERVWVLIESHVNLRSATTSVTDGLSAGVEAACEATVHDLIAQVRDEGRLEQVNWFSREGQALADGLVQDLETRLRAQG